MHVFNFSTRKVGGLRFVKLGRLTLSFCVSRGTFKPMKPAPSAPRLASRVINGQRVLALA